MARKCLRLGKIWPKWISRNCQNRGGDRAANCAVHITAIGRLRTDPRTTCKRGLPRELQAGGHLLPQAVHRTRGVHSKLPAAACGQQDPNRHLKYRRASAAVNTAAVRSRTRCPATGMRMSTIPKFAFRDNWADGKPECVPPKRQALCHEARGDG